MGAENSRELTTGAGNVRLGFGFVGFVGFVLIIQLLIARVDVQNGFGFQWVSVCVRGVCVYAQGSQLYRHTLSAPGDSVRHWQLPISNHLALALDTDTKAAAAKDTDTMAQAARDTDTDADTVADTATLTATVAQAETDADTVADTIT